MSWRDISLTWPCYQTRDGAMILSRVAFTCGPRPAESSSLVLRPNGCFGSEIPQTASAAGRQQRLRNELCRQEALLTTKDIELSASERRDLALKLLVSRFDLDSPALDVDRETLSITGGICKRKWDDLGHGHAGAPPRRLACRIF
jgi:hypothetical protein